MPTFRNIGAAVHVERSALMGGPVVATGETFEVPGDVTEDLGDGYVVGTGDDARVWPKAQWELVKSAAKAASVKEN